VLNCLQYKENVNRVVQYVLFYNNTAASAVIDAASLSLNSGKFRISDSAFFANTAPEFRARGYARALAGGLAQRARARGCGAVLYAGVENVPALRAYERAGFVTLGGYGIAYFFPRKIDRKIGM
jgi:predicted GNAT family acetyltransferase